MVSKIEEKLLKYYHERLAYILENYSKYIMSDEIDELCSIRQMLGEIGLNFPTLFELRGWGCLKHIEFERV